MSKTYKFVEFKEDVKIIDCKGKDEENCIKYCKENKEIVIIMSDTQLQKIGDRLTKECIIIAEGEINEHTG